MTAFNPLNAGRRPVVYDVEHERQINVADGLEAGALQAVDEVDHDRTGARL